MADQSEAGDTFSTCDWEDAAGVCAFGLTVYWSGGKEQWETWRLAQGLGDAALKSAEGVAASAVVKQGLVPGIGDAAYFSPVLPSLVLKGDTLFVDQVLPRTQGRRQVRRPRREPARECQVIGGS